MKFNNQSWWSFVAWIWLGLAVFDLFWIESDKFFECMILSYISVFIARTYEVKK